MEQNIVTAKMNPAFKTPGQIAEERGDVIVDLSSLSVERLVDLSREGNTTLSEIMSAVAAV